MGTNPTDTSLKKARKKLEKAIKEAQESAMNDRDGKPLPDYQRKVERAIDNLIAEAQAAVVLEKTRRT